VAGEVFAAQSNHGGGDDGAAGEDGDVGGAAADVHQAHAQLLLVLSQHGLGGGERLQDDVGDVQAGAVGALDDVLRAGDGARDDVHLGLQAHAGHAQGLL